MSIRFFSGFDIVCDEAIFIDNNLLYNLPNENKSPEFSKKKSFTWGKKVKMSESLK